MCVHVCMCVLMYMCVHVMCVHVYRFARWICRRICDIFYMYCIVQGIVDMHVYTINICIYTKICVHAYMCVLMYMCVCVCRYSCTHTQTHVYTCTFGTVREHVDSAYACNLWRMANVAYVYACVYIYVCVCVCIRIYTRSQHTLATNIELR